MPAAAASPAPARPFAPHTFMLVPTLACQAGCRYCFAPRQAGVMDAETLTAAIRAIDRLRGARRDVRVVFHGGEPLLAGEAFYRRALPALTQALGPDVRLSLQSNLWALDAAMLDLLAAWRVRVSTSLDGPQDICDAQRGAGYFRRTMAGIDLLRAAGMPVSVIATVTGDHVDDLARIAAFFAAENLPYTLRGAAAPLHGTRDTGALTDAQAERLSVTGLAYLAEHPEGGHVRDLEAPVRTAFYERSELCSFGGCLGHFAAIAPDGGIYPCQRFCGDTAYCMGYVQNQPSAATLAASPAYARLLRREAAVADACAGCAHIAYCAGGCLYARVAAYARGLPPPCGLHMGGGRALRAAFDFAALQLAGDMARALQGASAPTPWLAMAGDRPHPGDALRAKRAFAQAVRWGDTGAPRHAFYLQERRQEVYLNVTDRCPLRCTHCSVSAGEGGTDMPPALAADLYAQAVALGYRAVSLNGGEPLAHPQLHALLAALAAVPRGRTRLVLNTNLYSAPDAHTAQSLVALFDEITVSLDGDEAAHDLRRGAGAFARTRENVLRLLALHGRARITARAALSPAQRAEGLHTRVREAARGMGIQSVTISNLLPLGRAAQLPGARTLNAPAADEAFFRRGFAPRDGCGVGGRLHIAPDGVIYPCWGRMEAGDALGKAQDGLLPAMEALAGWVPIDSEPRCKACRFRYVCGGVCRAYGDAPCDGKRDAFAALLRIAEKA